MSLSSPPCVVYCIVFLLLFFSLLRNLRRRSINNNNNLTSPLKQMLIRLAGEKSVAVKARGSNDSQHEFEEQWVIYC